MKKLLSVLSVLCLAVVFAFAQDNPNTDTQEPGPAAKFETMEIDYGVIEHGSDPLRVFKFSNVGNEPLQITHAKGSCGCTVPKWPKEPIFPGEDAEIEVRYDTKRPGKFFKRVTLTTNDKTGSYVLNIKGEVKKKEAESEGVPGGAPSIFTTPEEN